MDALEPKVGIGYQEIKDENPLTILTPALAQRKTAKIILNNGLEAYLISDPQIQQSAAALCVKAGSWDNPKEYPGMAHFLEHMLFMGTKAYPDEGEYKRFITDHGGKMNAYTAPDRTAYMFSVNNNAFEGALDRFSHFFIDPLFKLSSLGRELNAVDQEHAKNIENDGNRLYMIFKETGNPAHPNAGFSTGNAQTLKDIPPESMKAWYKTHYIANKMCLVVLSSLPIDKLITLTQQDFSAVPSGTPVGQISNVPLTSSRQKGHMIYIKPIMDRKSLSLLWEVPQEFIVETDKKVPELIAYVLNHGGEKTLLDELKKLKLADGLNASLSRDSQDQGLFEISINLTDHGINQLEQIITLVFQTLEAMKTTGIPKYFYEEMNTMARLKYEYQSREDAFSFVMQYIHPLADESLATFPYKTIMASNYDPQALSAFLNTLTAENCIYFALFDPSKLNLRMTSKEKWMNAEYRIEPISLPQLKKWNEIAANPNIQLPAPNPFIPTHISLLNIPASSSAKFVPSLISNDETSKIYFAQDNYYLVPKVSCLLKIKSPLLDGSSKAMASTELYLKMFDQHLDNLLMNAGQAGFRIDIAPKDLDILIRIEGFNQKMPLVIEQIALQMKQFKPSKSLFDLCKVSLAADYANGSKELAFRQAYEQLQNLLLNCSPTKEEKLKALHSISYEEMVQFSEKWLKKGFSEGMVFGQISEQNAIQMTSSLKQAFNFQPYPPSEQHQKRILVLPNQSGPFMISYETAMMGNAVILLLEEGPNLLEKKASQQILGKLLNESFYDTLRTKQQTGYIAQAWDTEEENQLLQFFAVQSSTHQPSELLARFELFIETFVSDFAQAVPQQRFENVKSTVVELLKMPPENPYLMTHLLFALGFKYQGDFDYLNKLIEHVSLLNYTTFEEQAKAFLSRQNKRRIAILMEGATPADKAFRYEAMTKRDLHDVGRFVVKENP